jgi:hypothetical protein
MKFLAAFIFAFVLACIIHERMAKAFCGGLKLPKLLAAV